MQLETTTSNTQPGVMGSQIPIVTEWQKVDFEFRPTDLFNAQMFTEIGKGKILFIQERNRWYKWTGKVWQEDKNKTGAENITLEVIKRIYAMAGDNADENQRKILVKWGLESESESRRKAMISGAERSPVFVVKSEKFDTDDYLFNCQNGVIDLKTGELLPHDPSYFMTCISPCNYNPDIDSDLWNDTINRAMKQDAELIDFIQKYAGLTLTGDVNQKILVFLYGKSGHNGKSTITQALLHVMGSYGVQISVSTLMSGAKRSPGSASPDLAQMQGKRYVLTSETTDSIKINDQLIKDLTGRDMIPARALWGDSFYFSPKMKIWIYGNHKPAIRGNSPAMRQRLKLLPFEYQFEGSGDDTSAQDKLKYQHGDAILNWAVKGYKRFITEGLKETEKIKNATDQYFLENNNLQKYFNENFVQDENSQIQFSQLYSEAVDFLGWEKMSKSKFSSLLLSELGLSIIPGKGNARILKGWKFRDDIEVSNKKQDDVILNLDFM